MENFSSATNLVLIPTIIIIISLITYFVGIYEIKKIPYEDFRERLFAAIKNALIALMAFVGFYLFFAFKQIPVGQNDTQLVFNLKLTQAFSLSKMLIGYSFIAWFSVTINLFKKALIF